MKLSSVFALVSLTFCSAGSWQAPLRPHPPPACSEHLFLVSSNFPLTPICSSPPYPPPALLAFHEVLCFSCSDCQPPTWPQIQALILPDPKADGDVEHWGGVGMACGPPQPGGSQGRKEGSCLTHLELGSRGATAFPPSPFLEGIAAQLVHPPFLKGRDALSCFQFPGRQLLGKLWKCWSWQECPAQHQVLAAHGKLGSVSHPPRDRGSPGSSSCPFVLLSITVWQCPGHREWCCGN